MKCHVRLEHQLVDFAVGAQSPFFGFGKEEQPTVNDGIHFLQGLRGGIIRNARWDGVRNASDRAD